MKNVPGQTYGIRVLLLVLLTLFLWGCAKDDATSELTSEATGLQAVYYDNENFTGKQVTRVDTSLNFNWQDKAPALGIGPDTFSVRWTGSITPRYSELYTFTATADDGLRLWVNGIKLIDDWEYSPEKRYAKLRLEANKAYAIKIEYYEGEGWAGFNLFWSSPSQKSELVSRLSTLAGVATGLSASLPLKDLAAARGILIGGGIESETPLLNDSTFRAVAAREFSVLSPEGGFSISDTHSDQPPYNMLATLPRLDTQVNFALQNKAQIQVFHLVYYRESDWATWLNDIPSAQRWPFIKKHISDIMTRYKGKALYYNVVNEAFNDSDGKIRGSKFPDNNSINWLAPLGSSYIENSFREARRVDPSAKLFYNDYELEFDNVKWRAVLAMVKDFKARGVPIDGVGFQGHLDLDAMPDPAVLEEHFRQLHELGLEVRITEFDISIAGASGTEAERLARQAQYYKDFMNVCLGAPNCTAFQMWGFTDKYSWRRYDKNGVPGKPLIFDESYQKKPSYYGLQNALRGR